LLDSLLQEILLIIKLQEVMKEGLLHF